MRSISLPSPEYSGDTNAWFASFLSTWESAGIDCMVYVARLVDHAAGMRAESPPAHGQQGYKDKLHRPEVTGSGGPSEDLVALVYLREDSARPADLPCPTGQQKILDSNQSPGPEYVIKITSAH